MNSKIKTENQANIEARKLKAAIARQKETDKFNAQMQLETDKQNASNFSIETLKAIKKHGHVKYILTAFSKSKKLAKSLINKSIQLGHNIF